MESEGSLPRLQIPAICPYPEPDQSPFSTYTEQNAFIPYVLVVVRSVNYLLKLYACIYFSMKFEDFLCNQVIYRIALCKNLLGEANFQSSSPLLLRASGAF
jgi:hypothetical protein